MSSQREEQISHAVKRSLSKKNRNSNKVVRRTHSLILNEEKESAAAAIVEDVDMVPFPLLIQFMFKNIGPLSLPASQQVPI